MIADDHLMFRQGVRRMLREMADIEVAGEAGDGLELLSLLGDIVPDLVILDISMPKIRGIEAIPHIRTICPQAKVLVLTMHRDVEFLHQAVAAGADGYLLKEDAEKELFSAIDAVRGGSKYVSPLLAGEMANVWADVYRGKRKSPLVEPLSLREREVLKLIAEGKSNKEIATLLFISIHTVVRHRAKIMDKLKLKNTAELVRYALQKGYL
jgi:DNA-binding NarL/FixJ family response regulator